MGVEWTKSGAARRILVHWADARPAWLWSADGNSLIWRNDAARYFGAKLKKSGLKLAPDPVPIKGQVRRLVRLGSLGRSSLSRVQYLAGGKPGSTTATVTPLELAGGQIGVLIVGVDAIEPEILAQPAPANDRRGALFPPELAYLVFGPDGAVVDGSSGAIERFAALGQQGDGAVEVDGEQLTLTRLKASPAGHQLLLVEGARQRGPTIAEVRAEEGLGGSLGIDTEPDAEAGEEPLLPMGLPPVDEPKAEASAEAESEPVEAEEPARLSSLFDRLAGNEALYTELTPADEQLRRPATQDDGSAPMAPEVEPAAEAGSDATEVAAPVEAAGNETAVPEADPLLPSEPVAAIPNEPDVIAAVIEFDQDLRDEPVPQRVSYRVTGRGFTPLASEASDHDVPAEAEPAPAVRSAAPTDTEMVERTSRYNFDELSRILTDRVSVDLPPADEPVGIDPPIEPVRPPVAAAVNEGALINIAAETFILNRLPLGIMVFRDQQVLFANRALTDLAGYDSIDRLRQAGLSAIFPANETSAGPVTHLVRSDGTLMPVTARLQSITWQGRPALMLSASPAEGRIGHEAAVRGFAEVLAETRGEGFILADRSGIVTMMSAEARLLLGRREEEAAGDPLAALVSPEDGAALRDFLEKPARFAETARPSIVLRGRLAGSEILLFAEGQAGIVTGYFGFVRQRPKPETNKRDDADDIDPSMLARVSRGVRRPLNTIIGFADLIRSAAFGTIENHRYLEYARDIKTAGQEIAVLVDELDDYARLKAGKFALRTAELDLGALLESCIVRVRGQASAARVLVRSAISERLPHVRADRASLGQAVLNLLASAIDQTPAGGSVILSAQPEDDGSIVINVRDSGAATADLGERFVVFRDGVGKDGEALAPVRSSVGLALTRSLVAVNACSLSVDPAGAVGTLFSLVIPADLVGPPPAA